MKAQILLTALNIFLVLFSISFDVNAQSDEVARFPGCEELSVKEGLYTCAKEEMSNFIVTKINGFHQEGKEFTPGKMVVSFLVDTSGYIKDIFTLEFLDSYTDEIVTKAFEAMNQMEDRWLPTIEDNILMPHQYYSHIQFKSNNQFELTNPYSNREEPEQVFKITEQMPRFPGCEDIDGPNKQKDICATKKMLEYIYSNIDYPEEARKNGITGTVVVQFTVNKEGVLENFKVIRDPNPFLTEAALDSVKSMNGMDQKWIPGRLKGVPVKVLYTLPIKFSLDG